MKRLLAIARKELRHILRDPRSLLVALVMPAAMVVLYGYGIDTELRDLPLGILDEDRTEASRALIRRVLASEFIRDAGRIERRAEIEPAFRRERFRAVMVVPPGYGEAELGSSGARVSRADPARIQALSQASLPASNQAQVQLLIDGADASTAAIVESYLRAALAGAGRGAGEAGAPPADPRVRILFNPELESAHFIVPGLVAVILIMICALLTSIAITREKETGTMEQVLTTPVRPAQLVLGKVAPYLLIAIADAILVLAVGRIVFHVPMRGSWGALAGYSFLYLMVALGLGLLISTVARSQRVAMTVALVATMLPTIILSGFVFPFASMPWPLQALGRVIPATYYLPIIRGIMLTGRAWYPLEGAVLAGMAVLLLALSIRRFGTRLEA